MQVVEIMPCMMGWRGKAMAGTLGSSSPQWSQPGCSEELRTGPLTPSDSQIAKVPFSLSPGSHSGCMLSQCIRSELSLGRPPAALAHHDLHLRPWAAAHRSESYVTADISNICLALIRKWSLDWS
ncbi:hypothetical protein AAFF_G00269470 [Aldrovandia affinis]|uniref:Uncharacterized protein n=1 Tax=Aldrovandia affinis TaxID=143900 RepID=A0AAD7SSK1_9TELE|nr:hypothetical protein AAFF_G00269470 [Aldrovandia affinis]